MKIEEVEDESENKEDAKEGTRGKDGSLSVKATTEPGTDQTTPNAPSSSRPSEAKKSDKKQPSSKNGPPEQTGAKERSKPEGGGLSTKQSPSGEQTSSSKHHKQERTLPEQSQSSPEETSPEQKPRSPNPVGPPGGENQSSPQTKKPPSPSEQMPHHSLHEMSKLGTSSSSVADPTPPPPTSHGSPTPSAPPPTQQQQQEPLPSQATPPATPPATPTEPKIPALLPPLVQKKKEEGNDKFRAGQYVEATKLYSTAISMMEKASKDLEGDPSCPLALLLNNRAFCHLKNGDCRGCVEDSTRSLSLLPLNVKALIRRGSAYEMMEKYGLAYSDFELAIKIDASIDAAWQARTRLSKHLMVRDGGDWRNKLPRPSEADSVMEALNKLNSMRQNSTTTNNNNSTQSSDINASMPSKSNTNTSTSTSMDDPSPRASDDGCTCAFTTPGATPVANAASSGGGDQKDTSVHVHASEGSSGTDKTASSNVPSDAKGEDETGLVSEHSETSTCTSSEAPLLNSQAGKVLENEMGAGTESSGSSDSGCSGGGGLSSENETAFSTATTTSVPPPGFVPSVATCSTASSPGQLDTKVTHSTPHPITTSSTTDSTLSEGHQHQQHPSPPQAVGEDDSDSDRQFENSKTKGNECVKKGDHLQALVHYNLCVQCKPEAPVGYTNRAFCHLKLKSPRNAEEDCTKALELDHVNIKALYRRAQARKDLGRYLDAMRDLKTLLELEPGNSAASKEHAIVKDLWEKELRELQIKQQSQKAFAAAGNNSTESGANNKPSKKPTTPTQAEAQAHTHTPASPHPPPPPSPSVPPLLQKNGSSRNPSSPSSLLSSSSSATTSPSHASFAESRQPHAAPAVAAGVPPPPPRGVGASAHSHSAGHVHTSSRRRQRSVKKPTTQQKQQQQQAKKSKQAQRQQQPPTTTITKPPESVAATPNANATPTPPNVSTAVPTSACVPPPTVQNPSCSTTARRGGGGGGREGEQQQDSAAATASVERLLGVDKGRRGRGGEGEQSDGGGPTPSGGMRLAEEQEPLLISAAKTTYYKDKDGLSSAERGGGGGGGEREGDVKRRVIVEEGDLSSEEEEEEEEKETGKGAKERMEGGDGGKGREGERERGVGSPSPHNDGVTNTTGQLGESKVKKEPEAKREISLHSFIQRWNSLNPRHSSSRLYAELLEELPPEELPKVITSKLDGATLSSLVDAIDKELLPKGAYELSAQVLQNLCSVQRFEMVSMFLSRKEKEVLGKMLDAIEANCRGGLVSSAALRKAYGLRSSS